MFGNKRNCPKPMPLKGMCAMASSSRALHCPPPPIAELSLSQRDRPVSILHQITSVHPRKKYWPRFSSCSTASAYILQHRKYTRWYSASAHHSTNITTMSRPPQLISPQHALSSLTTNDKIVLSNITSFVCTPAYSRMDMSKSKMCYLCWNCFLMPFFSAAYHSVDHWNCPRVLSAKWTWRSKWIERTIIISTMNVSSMVSSAAFCDGSINLFFSSVPRWVLQSN